MRAAKRPEEKPDNPAPSGDDAGRQVARGEVVLALGESVDRVTGHRPVGDDGIDPPGCVLAPEQVEQTLTRFTWPLSHDLDPTVGPVGGVTRQAELERPSPSPPAKPDTLDVAVHPGGEPVVSPRHVR